MKHCTEVGLGSGHIVLDGDPALPQRGIAPIFAPFCCGQTAGWITMSLGTEVGLDPGDRHIALDGDPAHQKGGTAAPQFLAHVCCGQTVKLIKMPLGREVGLGPGDIVLDGDPAPPQKTGHSHPIFGPCLLWSNVCIYQDTT